MTVTPEYISSLVNFYSNSLKPDWSFETDGKDMRNLQVLGAAKAYNLLEKEKLALLADEVGMGKTIQALSICAALWNQKPDARVLVLAPRDEVARNWEREYQTFISHHYRHGDNLVKSAFGDEPIRKMNYCQNLYSLVHGVQQGWGRLFIGKISSFSSLMAGNKSLERLEKLNIKGLSRARQLAADRLKKTEFSNEIIRLLRNEVDNHTNGKDPYFDLVIIDEAHYLRNTDGGSLKVNSARIFFDAKGDNNVAIAKRVLLMTATPNHSSANDIRNIVSYFTSKYENWTYREILDAICIRRLRRLSSKALNKYNYRYEQPSPSDFKGNPLSEMFFGLYQHELAREIHANQKENGRMRGVSGIMKYLEGLEFLPRDNDQSTIPETNVNDDETKGNSSDFDKGSDSRILKKLSIKFNDVFNKYPSHPKYEKLVDDLTAQNVGDKAVVFVRRIPSVREISRRVLEYYDRRFWNILQNGSLADLRLKNLSRKNFNNAVGQIVEGDDDSTVQHEQPTDESNIPTSKVFNLFKIIKHDVTTYTSASRFRTRFNHSNPSIFSLFFSPGSDYFMESYINLKSHKFQVGKEELDNYYNSALIHRVNNLLDKGSAKDILSLLLNKNPILGKNDVKEELIPTLMTIFWDTLLADNNLAQSEKEEIVAVYKHKLNNIEKEAFSNFLEKGALLASEAVIIFFDEFRKVQASETDKPLKIYLDFCERIRDLFPGLLLYRQIIESILHFKVIYTKVFSINSDKELLDETWDSFNNAQPIYPYNAENSNQKVLRCFNTPFYPVMLVATSVLQEGVNLQYFCNTVYHYGMAWTPGDNEQRIGRIDRMFGKIERLLEQDEKSTLKIFYPYLKDTVDEDHLGRFAKRKYREESLIDLGKSYQDSTDYALEENEINGWKRFFREPEISDLDDPFPAGINDFIGLTSPKKIQRHKEMDEYYHSIINALREIKTSNSELFFIENNNWKSILADPHLHNNRMQPVIIEIVLDHVGTGLAGEAVFCLKMRTPLAPLSQYRKLRYNFYQNTDIQDLYLPGIKLCLDPSQTTGSNWAIYMTNELPLFITEIKENPLSVEEIQKSFSNLVACADLTEKVIFERDLKKEELNLPLNSPNVKTGANFRKADGRKIDHSWHQEGEFLILNHEVNQDRNSLDPERNSFIVNHRNTYIKSILSKAKLNYQVSYLADDACKKELELMEKHLQVFINESVWE